MLYLKRLKKDFILRQKYSKNSIKLWKLKGLINNKILAPRIRIKNRELLNKLVSVNKISQTRVNNRCLLTGRSRGVIKEFGISRIVFKKLADDGKLLSIIKK
tara:strand:- start:1623 stop:1928 length:306 start_codon:yes stop_codon:yes gene_type:complete